MDSPKVSRLRVLGALLDVDESESSVAEKVQVAGSRYWDNPCAAIVQALKRDRSIQGKVEYMADLRVPRWLTPVPRREDLALLSVGNFVRFVEHDGCRGYRRGVYDFVKNEIQLGLPCILGVDHCLSGGSIEACSEHYGRDNLSLVVLDSHLDAISTPVMAGAIRYDIEQNPASVYDANDPYLHNRRDSYNTASFLRHIVFEERLVRPENVYFVGVADYPSAKPSDYADYRMKDYINQYYTWEEHGSTIIRREDVLADPISSGGLLSKVQTPYLYVSLDMDIGARAATNAVRFTNREGLTEDHIYYLATCLRRVCQDSDLVGLDVMEVNCRYWLAGAEPDRAHEIAANFIKIVALGAVDHLINSGRC